MVKTKKQFNPAALSEVIRGKKVLQKALAKSIDCTPSQLSQWINGKHAPGAAVVRRMAKALAIKESRLYIFAEPEAVTTTGSFNQKQQRALDCFLEITPGEAMQVLEYEAERLAGYTEGRSREALKRLLIDKLTQRLKNIK